MKLPEICASVKKTAEKTYQSARYVLRPLKSPYLPLAANIRESGRRAREVTGLYTEEERREMEIEMERRRSGKPREFDPRYDCNGKDEPLDEEWNDEDEDDQGEFHEGRERKQLSDEDLEAPPCMEGDIRVCGTRMEVQTGNFGIDESYTAATTFRGGQFNSCSEDDDNRNCR